MTGTITHTARLPFGYEVEFIWTASGMRTEWSPDVPCIRKPRAFRRFFDAYKEARAEFFTSVATVLGGNVGVLDVDGSEMQIIRPGTRH